MGEAGEVGGKRRQRMRGGGKEKGAQYLWGRGGGGERGV